MILNPKVLTKKGLTIQKRTRNYDFPTHIHTYFEILNTNNIFDDVDVILLAYSVINKLNLHKYHLDINCIGSIQTRIK